MQALKINAILFLGLINTSIFGIYVRVTHKYQGSLGAITHRYYTDTPEDYDQLRKDYNERKVADEDYTKRVLSGYDRMYAFFETLETKAQRNEELSVEEGFFVDYFKRATQLNWVPSAGVTLIGPNWVIGAKHNMNQVEGVHYSFGMYKGNDGQLHQFFGLPKKIYHHPKYDIALLLTQGIVAGIDDSNARPVKRYYGALNSRTTYYMKTDKLHNQAKTPYFGRGLSSTLDLKRISLFSGCSPTGDLSGGNVQMGLVNYGEKLLVETHGGDSNAGVFAEVSHTGDPYEDYRFLGVNSGPGGRSFGMVSVVAPDVSNWITNIMIGEAVGRPFQANLVHPRAMSDEEEEDTSPPRVIKQLTLRRADPQATSGGLQTTTRRKITLLPKDHPQAPLKLDDNRVSLAYVGIDASGGPLDPYYIFDSQWAFRLKKDSSQSQQPSRGRTEVLDDFVQQNELEAGGKKYFFAQSFKMGDIGLELVKFDHTYIGPMHIRDRTLVYNAKYQFSDEDIKNAEILDNFIANTLIKSALERSVQVISDTL